MLKMKSTLKFSMIFLSIIFIISCKKPSIFEKIEADNFEDFLEISKSPLSEENHKSTGRLNGMESYDLFSEIEVGSGDYYTSSIVSTFYDPIRFKNNDKINELKNEVTGSLTYSYKVNSPSWITNLKTQTQFEYHYSETKFLYGVGVRFYMNLSKESYLSAENIFDKFISELVKRGKVIKFSTTTSKNKSDKLFIHDYKGKNEKNQFVVVSLFKSNERGPYDYYYFELMEEK